MQSRYQIPLVALGTGAAFTVIFGVANPMEAYAEVRTYTGGDMRHWRYRDAGLGEEPCEVMMWNFLPMAPSCS